MALLLRGSHPDAPSGRLSWQFRDCHVCELQLWNRLLVNFNKLGVKTLTGTHWLRKLRFHLRSLEERTHPCTGMELGISAQRRITVIPVITCPEQHRKLPDKNSLCLAKLATSEGPTPGLFLAPR